MRKLLILISAFGIIILVYNIWAESGRNSTESPINTEKIHFSEENDSTNNGNFISIQAFMSPQDYQSEKTFFKKLDFYFAQAASKKWLSNKSIVVLPEYLGTWLVVAEEKQSVYSNTIIQKSLETMVMSNVFSFVNAYFHSKAKDKIKDAVFRMKAKKMAEIYSDTFSRLAKKYEVYIVGGSIILPKPYIKDGQIVVSDKELYNTSFLFHPNGNIDNNVVLKVYSTKDEQDFIADGELANLPVFKTNAGKLGIAICADSWYPDIYQYFDDKNVELVAIPSFAIPDGILSIIWNGYSGYPEPKDVDLSDIKTITEEQAWEKYALLGRYKNHDFKAGTNVFMRGKLWDLGSDGRTYSFNTDTSFIGQQINEAVISCLWF